MGWGGVGIIPTMSLAPIHDVGGMLTCNAAWSSLVHDATLVDGVGWGGENTNMEIHTCWAWWLVSLAWHSSCKVVTQATQRVKNACRCGFGQIQSPGCTRGDQTILLKLASRWRETTKNCISQPELDIFHHFGKQNHWKFPVSMEKWYVNFIHFTRSIPDPAGCFWYCDSWIYLILFDYHISDYLTTNGLIYVTVMSFKEINLNPQHPTTLPWKCDAENPHPSCRWRILPWSSGANRCSQYAPMICVWHSCKSSSGHWPKIPERKKNMKKTTWPLRRSQKEMNRIREESCPHCFICRLMPGRPPRGLTTPNR